MSSLFKSLSNISKTLVIVGRCIGKIWMHHRPIRVIFLAISSTWLVTYSILSTGQRPISRQGPCPHLEGPCPWKADRSVGIWCADKEVGSLVANTTVGPHAAGNSILCCIPSFLGTAITRCDTFGRTQPSPARIFDEAKQYPFTF